MKILNKCFSVFLCLILMSSLISCKKFESNDNYLNFKDISNNVETVDSGTITENDKFALVWVNETKSIRLIEKKTNKVWSTTPIKDGEEVEDTQQIYSPINLSYILCSGYRTITLTGKLGALVEGRVSAKLINNGIRLMFLFDKVSIGIPLEFVLTNEGLSVSVKYDDIAEDKNTDFRAFEIELLPFFMSVENSAENYLFYPSGSGALMYTDERDSGKGREYEAKIYGNDIAVEMEELVIKENQVNLPVFGAVSNSTMCAIVEEGSEKAYIYAKAGDAVTGYSNISVKFRVRGHNPSVLDYGGSTGKKTVNNYSDNIISGATAKICYYPLSNEKTGYISIADKYREYLTSKYELKSTNETNALSLKFYGALEVKDFIFGLPYMRTEAVTTFEDVQNILNILGKYSSSLDINLMGFGKEGTSVGEIAGGFSYSKKVGNKKTLNSLIKLCDSNGYDTYYNFDTVNFSESSKGFSKTKNVVETTNGYPIQVFTYSPATNTKNISNKPTYILSRNQLSKVVDKAIKASKSFDIKGISLSPLSYMAYSDYGNQKYPVCSFIQEDIKNIISNMKQNGFLVAGTNSNDYYSCLSNKIYDAPSESGMSDSFDLDIPFYQIVFKGYVDMSLPSVNIAVNQQKQILKSMETGCALQFSLINNYNTEYAFDTNENLQLMKWDNNKQLIEKTLEENLSSLNTIKGLKIKDYIIINEKVRKTIFEDGTIIYINYGSTDYSNGDVSVASMNYKVVS